MQALPADARERATAAPPPAHAALMKAVLERRPFSDGDWIFERKLDGIRCLAIHAEGETRMLSRNDLDLAVRFPELQAALGAQRGHAFAVDGEIVALEHGQTSFARLAQRSRRPAAIFLYLFDLLWLDGRDVRGLALLERKRLLETVAIRFADPLRCTEHRVGDGEAMFAQACRDGWEGVIGKRADSVYRDARSRDWVKFKCEAGQELVIGGYTAPRGSRECFGALLLGYHDGDGRLRYAGKVGTGFDQATLHALAGRMAPLARPAPPFADADRIHERGVSWVAPELVAQVAFTEWTAAGRLRHPRFLGLREDKAADQVVRER